MLSDHGLTKLVDVPTHRWGHTLDWAVVRSDVSCLVLERVDDMTSPTTGPYVRWWSQHQANQSVLSHLETPRLCLFLIFRRTSSVSQIATVSVPKETLRIVAVTVMDRHAPLVTCCVCPRRSAPWKKITGKSVAGGQLAWLSTGKSSSRSGPRWRDAYGTPGSFTTAAR